MPEDTLSVPLSLADIEELKPEMVLQIHDKLRRAHADAVEHSTHMKEELANTRKQLANAQQMLHRSAQELSRRDAALAKYAMALINGHLVKGEPTDEAG